MRERNKLEKCTGLACPHNYQFILYYASAHTHAFSRQLRTTNRQGKEWILPRTLLISWQVPCLQTEAPTTAVTWAAVTVASACNALSSSVITSPPTPSPTTKIIIPISMWSFSSSFEMTTFALLYLLQPYTPARRLQSASDTWTFVTARVNTKTFGKRSSSYTGPSVWKGLQQTLRHSDSASSFKAASKTHLFNNYF